MLGVFPFMILNEKEVGGGRMHLGTEALPPLTLYLCILLELKIMVCTYGLKIINKIPQTKVILIQSLKKTNENHLVGS